MTISLWIVLIAGIVSFLSPCTLPLFPSYLGYVAGVSFGSLAGQNQLTAPPRKRAFFHAICFCIGLSMIFVALGLGFTALGHTVHEYKTWVRILGGCILIVMGLFMADRVKSRRLWATVGWQLPPNDRASYFGSFLVGVVFAAGWTPCIGPILSSVLALVMVHPDVGYRYMVVYTIGFSIPFVILSVLAVSVRPLLRYTERVRRIGGWVLVAAGMLLMTGKMTILAAWFQQITGFTGI